MVLDVYCEEDLFLESSLYIGGVVHIANNHFFGQGNRLHVVSVYQPPIDERGCCPAIDKSIPLDTMFS